MMERKGPQAALAELVEAAFVAIPHLVDIWIRVHSDGRAEASGAMPGRIDPIPISIDPGRILAELGPTATASVRDGRGWEGSVAIDQHRFRVAIVACTEGAATRTETAEDAEIDEILNPRRHEPEAVKRHLEAMRKRQEGRPKVADGYRISFRRLPTATVDATLKTDI